MFTFGLVLFPGFGLSFWLHQPLSLTPLIVLLFIQVQAFLRVSAEQVHSDTFVFSFGFAKNGLHGLAFGIDPCLVIF